MSLACAVLVVQTAAARSDDLGPVQLGSRAADGSSPNDASLWPALSADGRYLAYWSRASDIVPDDTNGKADVFVLDRQTGATTRVSRPISGEGDGESYSPSISYDGRYVAFESSSTNLVADDTNGVSDAFVFDRETEGLSRVSLGENDQQSNGQSWFASISGDGTSVGFWSMASNLGPGDTNSSWDVYVRDIAAGKTERASLSETNAEAASHWLFWPECTPSLDRDGSVVAFCTEASLAAGDQNENRDAYIRDLDANETEQASIGYDGKPANGWSSHPSLSADGTLISFWSAASNLVPTDLNGNWDVFVYDRTEGTTDRITVTSAGEETDGAAYNHFDQSMSKNGRFVAFETIATDVGYTDTNGWSDVYVYDRVARTTRRVSMGSAGDDPSSWSQSGVVSPDGTVVAFESDAPNLVTGDDNAIMDVFTSELPPRWSLRDLFAGGGPQGPSLSGIANFDAVTVAEATDPIDDGGPATDALGGDLSSTSIVYRESNDDLFVEIVFDDFAGLEAADSSSLAPGMAGLPTISSELDLTNDSGSYRIIATRPGDIPDNPTEARISLQRCSGGGCTDLQELRGGIGTTGESVVFSVSLDALGMTEGQELRDLEVSTALVSPSGEMDHRLDEMTLSDLILPPRSIEVEAGSFKTLFTTDTSGQFSISLPADVRGRTAQLRACLGEICGSAVMAQL